MCNYSNRYDGVFVHESSYIDDNVDIGKVQKFGISAISLATAKLRKLLHGTKRCRWPECANW